LAVDLLARLGLGLGSQSPLRVATWRQHIAEISG
jgi:hypothetical protein